MALRPRLAPLFASLALLAVGCDGSFGLSPLRPHDTEPTPVGPIPEGSDEYVAFATVIRDHCMDCHFDGPGPSFAHLETEADWVNSPYLRPGSLETSSIYYRLQGATAGYDRYPVIKSMPASAEPLPAEDVAAVERFVMATRDETGLAACVAEPARVRPVQSRRLTGIEWARTVSTLLGVTLDTSGSTLPAEPRLPGGLVSDAVHAENYNYVDEAQLVMSSLLLTTLDREAQTASRDFDWDAGEHGMDPAACSDTSQGCLTEVLRPLAERLFGEGTLGDEDVAPYALIAKDRADGGASRDEALRFGVRALLLSPRFLIRQRQTEQLGHEHLLADRLAWRLWGTPPDATLLAYLDDGDPRSLEDQLDAEVRRMLADPRADYFAREFASSWLFVKQTPPSGISASLIDAFADETVALFRDVLERDAPLSELLTADYTFVQSEEQAEVYGLEPDQVGRVSYSEMPGPPRSGLLGQSSQLMRNDVIRGVWTLDRLLCRGLPPPPADVDAEADRVDSFCANCHHQIDAFAPGYGGFDTRGAVATEEQIATQNLLSAASPGTLYGAPYRDQPEMAALVAASAEFRECFAGHLTSYLTGSDMVSSTRGDRCHARNSAQRAAALRAEPTISDFVVAVVTSELFRAPTTD